MRAIHGFDDNRLLFAEADMPELGYDPVSYSYFRP
jgi:hypothetical protein